MASRILRKISLCRTHVKKIKKTVLVIIFTTSKCHSMLHSYDDNIVQHISMYVCTNMTHLSHRERLLLEQMTFSHARLGICHIAKIVLCDRCRGGYHRIQYHIFASKRDSNSIFDYRARLINLHWKCSIKVEREFILCEYSKLLYNLIFIFDPIKIKREDILEDYKLLYLSLDTRATLEHDGICKLIIAVTCTNVNLI